MLGNDYEGRTSGSLAWRLSRGETSTASIDKKFIFIPTADEVKAQEMIVRYSIIKDLYIRNDNLVTQKWTQCVFSSRNIFRKYEKDWKNFYLSRTGKVK